ncbi:unnamed protein product [Camellia sinensis]
MVVIDSPLLHLQEPHTHQPLQKRERKKDQEITMVFPSIPAYLDPSNWQQQQPNPQTGGGTGGNPHLLLPPPPPPPPPTPAQTHAGSGGPGSGSIRPGSMADRARMANIPMPEAALKCPRCDSTNTKFCYFNNYSLTQPRHFCKTCRRYWTRGGALRNVPVGGGCRRNKRSKGSSSSKSPVSSGDGQTSSGGSSSAISSNSTGTASLLGLPQQMKFMSPLSQLSEYGGGGGGGIGLNYSGISAPSDMNFQLPSGSFGGGSYFLGGGEQWRLQTPPPQISSLMGLDFPAGLYPFQGGLEPPSYGGEGSHVRPKISGSGLSPQVGSSLKMEDNQELNLSRQFLGIPGNDQFWSGTTGTNAWTDLSGFTSSSTSNNNPL